MKKHWILHGLVVASLLAGCGSDSNSGNIVGGGPFTGNAADTRSLIIVEPAADTLQRDGDDVDTLEVEAFDASGNVVFGPVDIAFDEQNIVNGIPSTARTIQIDYLRNGGFMLYRAEVPYTGQEQINDPREQPTAPNNTHYKVQASAGGFQLVETKSGPDRSFDGIRSKEGEQKTVRIKGVCYSPTPINDSNKLPPQNGDVFWDQFPVGSTDTIFGWAALFLKFNAQGVGPDNKSRDDFSKIRALNANAVRLYACHAQHLGNKGEFLRPGDPNYHLFTHKVFLDGCWKADREDQKLMVIADIPMPDIAFDLRAFKRDKDGAAHLEWWDDTFRKSVTELVQHPAVVAINIMNEQDGPYAHPNTGAGPDDENTRYFYAQAKKYADLVKEIGRTTPGGQEKLCGWAFHDSPDLVIFGSKFPTEGPKYLEQLTSFDYWGVNTYQTTNLDSLTGLPPERFRGTYAGLTGAMKKPLLLTELGWPSTGHTPDTADGKLYADSGTAAKTAEVITRMFNLVFASDLYLGACYFEFCDEWWKQDDSPLFEWNASRSSSTFPNGWNDEEGFGLYGVSRQGGRPDNDRNFITFGPDPDALYGSKGPKQPYDKLIPRDEAIKALTDVYKSVK